LVIHTGPVAGAYRSKTLIAKGQYFRLNLGKGETLEVNAADLLP
jgi:hypothetical protein